MFVAIYIYIKLKSRLSITPIIISSGIADIVISSGYSNMLITYGYLLLFVLYSTLKALREDKYTVNGKANVVLTH